MAYNVIITKRADDQLDHILFYLVHGLKNPTSARRLISLVDDVICQLELNPYIYALSQDIRLRQRAYREVSVTSMRYQIVYRINKQDVIILGIFHELEDRAAKL